MFLGWFDDTRKKDPHEKIEEAVERYVAKFGAHPTFACSIAADATQFDGMEVKASGLCSPQPFLGGPGRQRPESDWLQ